MKTKSKYKKKPTPWWIILITLFFLQGFCSISFGRMHKLKIDAKEAILIDAETRQILLSQNAHQRLQPASFTKIMTLYLIFDALENHQIQLDEKIPISRKAWRTGGSKMFVKVGTSVPLRKLIKGIAVVSGNDACVAVAEYLLGSVENFVMRMNEVVQEIGLKDTHFTSPNGLPSEKQYTTAYDMAMLAASYIERFPQALKYHSMQEYTYQGITQRNRNGLLRKAPNLVDGLKTGYVAEAGYHLIATGKKKNMRLIAVVMGAKSPAVREREALKLLRFGFGNFIKLDLFDRDKPITKVKVWKGTEREIRLVPETDGHVVVPVSQKKTIRVVIEAPKSLFAPLKKGTPEGVAKIISVKKTLKKVNLLVGSDVPEAGILVRTYHSLLLITSEFHLNNTLLIALAAMLCFLILIKFLRKKKKKRRRFY